MDELQQALSITYKNASDKDKLKLVYGAMLQNIATSALFSRFVNRNYSGTPQSGGTIRVKRMKFSESDDYGTARAAGQGNKLQNNGVDVKIGTRKEIVEEVEGIDITLYGVPEILALRRADHQVSMSVTLDKAYFAKLQNVATVVDLSSETNIEDKVLKLIQTLEGVENDNVQKVDRAFMVLTLAPKFYDKLVKYTQTLPSLLNQGANGQFFHQVEVVSAPRQTLDAVIQVRGSLALPVVIDNYTASRIPLTNAFTEELYYTYGLEAVTPDLVLAGALEGDISV